MLQPVCARPAGRLEAEDCNSIRCAQLISGGRRRMRPCPPHCLAHARPTMCCIRYATVTVLLTIFLIRGARAIAPTRRGAERSAPPIVEATAHRGRAVNLRACALAV